MEEKATQSRKQQHVELCVNENVTFHKKTNGFENYEFIHNALPECNFSEISTETNFLGIQCGMPLLISCMTGGYPDAERINRELAEVCENLKLPMGVGSQRQALENSSLHRSFQIVRESAPSIPILSNIGAPEVAMMQSSASVQRIIDLISADALVIHLNPLQELLQPEGSPNFRGVLNSIERLVKELEIPVIVKEVGAGISGDVAKRLLSVGVSGIDVAGAGGTSWAGVEILRNEEKESISQFWDWGIPTAECLEQVTPLKSDYRFTIISSGGISSAMEIALSLALGADFCASARPMLTALMTGGQRLLYDVLDGLKLDLRRIQFLVGAVHSSELRNIGIRKNIK
ncbi:MAG: type 2 isopentenyl-diphosphate Delta-isomerase [Ignavibacteriae bacterium]|nr:type 2 isopentenyl-diphosphate Delta-isomerase [Ignavibacteriota bacterium]